MRWQQYGTGTITLKREELYRLVWSVPGSRLAIQLGISDVGLSKVCRRHFIPRPPRGYWARLEAGQKPRKMPLPKTNGRGHETVYMKGWNMPEQTAARIACCHI